MCTFTCLLNITLMVSLAFIVFLLPYSITRLLMIAGYRVSSAAVMFAFACWYILGPLWISYFNFVSNDSDAGMVNVLILYNTFRLLSPSSRWITSNDAGVSLFQTAAFSPRSDVQRQDDPLSRVPKWSSVDSLPIPRTPTVVVSLPNRGGTMVEYGSSNRVYQPRNISPESELNDKIDISCPTPAMLRERTERLRLAPLNTHALSSAPRSTRSPIVRHPTNEGIPVISEASVLSLVPSPPYSKVPRPTSESEIFGVSPYPHSAGSLDDQQPSHGLVIHVRHSLQDRTPWRRSAISSESNQSTSTLLQTVPIRPLPPTPMSSRPTTISGYWYCNDEELTARIDSS